MIFILMSFLSLNADENLATCHETLSLFEESFTRKDTPIKQEDFNELKEEYLMAFDETIGLINSENLSSEIFNTIQNDPLARCYYLKDAYLISMEQYREELQKMPADLQLRIRNMDVLLATLNSLAGYAGYLQQTTTLNFGITENTDDKNFTLCHETISLFEESFSHKDAPIQEKQFNHLKEKYLMAFDATIGLINSENLSSEIFNTIKNDSLAKCHYLRDSYLDSMEQYKDDFQENLNDLLEWRMESMDNLIGILNSLSGNYTGYLEQTTSLKFN